MAQQIQHRRGTAAAAASANPVLASGEIGFETDTGLFKIGDGVTEWTSLGYAGGGGEGGAEGALIATNNLGDLTNVATARINLELGNAATLTVDSDIATLSVPPNTTISTFGASLVDDTAASDARTTLGLGTAATATIADFAVACRWTGSTWVTNSGGTVPTDAALIRTFYSQDDPAATAPPGPYNANDLWFGASS